MPWWALSPTGHDRAGLMFAAFGHSQDSAEAQLRRMLDLEDGITSAQFGFSSTIRGGDFRRPPMHQGQIDLRLLGINAA